MYVSQYVNVVKTQREAVAGVWERAGAPTVIAAANYVPRRCLIGCRGNGRRGGAFTHHSASSRH